MAGAMVSVSSGALSSLLGKLTTLMGEEYAKLKGVRKEVASLTEEFSSMQALLEDLANMDELDAQAKEWRNQVRDMSYDIEDCIDEFMHHFKKNEADTGFVKKTGRLLKKLRARHQIASKIQEIKLRVKEVSERRIRYKLDEYKAKHEYVPVDPRVVAIHTEAASLVGIDVPREELVKLLTEDDVHELKVVSIVGFGGLGKTTLANQVYRQLEGNFECRAFVSVSLKPDIPKLLNKILVEIGGVACQNGELDDILKNIKLRLQSKRYFIVIDDLWSSSAWKVIQCAFSENKCGSRVVTTTRNYDVALACCSYNKQYVYNMRPLVEEDSRRLFFRRIFGSGEACPNEFEELSAGILKKCSGLPLAIISIASLLAGQSKMAWLYVRNSLCSMFEGNPSLEDMKRILDLSYRNLPGHLKTCLLYFGMYPEDRTIEKDDLVRQWIAEGFVSKVHGLDKEDVARSYFNELINMSMIQPVWTDFNDEVLSCRVHDIMLDLIRVRCVEENFIDIVDDPHARMELQKKTRRVSLHFNNVEDGVILPRLNGSLSQVRSAIAVMGTSMLYSFSGFKYVRVLFIEMNRSGKIDLSGIHGLFLLRYLKIDTRCKLELPNELWSLRNLETMVLSLYGNKVVCIPSDIAHMRRLLHLSVLNGAFQDTIGRLRSLRTLEWFNISKSSLDSLKSLGELANLRSLRLYCESSDLNDFIVDALRNSVERVLSSNSLKSLVISNWDFRDLPFCISTLSQFPCHIQRLQLRRLRLPRIPKWIAQLHDLYRLDLAVSEVVPKDEDIGILAGLPSLVSLRLKIIQDPEEKMVIPGNGVAFPALKEILLLCPKPLLAFEAGAMRRLKRLELWLGSAARWEDVLKWVEPVGIERLPAGVKTVQLHCWGRLADEAMKSALRSVFNTHHPGVDLVFYEMKDLELLMLRGP
ncbi:hypothetical protein ACP4OV_003094 [Aristida adscensionis]